MDRTDRIAKLVRRWHTGVVNSYGYPIWVYRVVECRPDQQGYLSEKGVELLWESEPITYHTTQPGTKCGEALAEGERICKEANERLQQDRHVRQCLAVGLDPTTPESILQDYLQDIKDGVIHLR